MKNLKRKVVAVVLMAVMMMTSVNVPLIGNVATVQAATIKISKAKVSMKIAQKVTLKIIGTKSKVTWKTGDKQVATVSSKGVVTAQAEGTTKITATANKKKYTCNVTVKPAQNPYQVNAKFQEVQTGGLSFVVPSIYKASSEKTTDGSYKMVMKLPDSKSTLTFIATYTGKPAESFDDTTATYDTLDEQELQKQYDSTYGKGVFEVSDYATDTYHSENGTDSYVYGFLLTTKSLTAKTISYNLSIDGYTLEVIALDVEGYDIYLDAEYLIDSLLYVE